MESANIARLMGIFSILSLVYPFCTYFVKCNLHFVFDCVFCVYMILMKISIIYPQKVCHPGGKYVYRAKDRNDK